MNPNWQEDHRPAGCVQSQLTTNYLERIKLVARAGLELWNA